MQDTRPDPIFLTPFFGVGQMRLDPSVIWGMSVKKKVSAEFVFDCHLCYGYR